MPPVLNPHESKVDGLAFLGLSLTRKSTKGHADSQTHQTAFDLNEVIDRDYNYLASTNDDGWLVGGGEPPETYKLTSPDTAHVELMRIGTYRADWGGLGQEEILRALKSANILIPEITVVPTAVIANGDCPPELEIRFDMEPAYHNDNGEPLMEGSNMQDELQLPVNWQLRFIHNQLFRYFSYASRFCPGAFHSTICRKAEFRSPELRDAYFGMCEEAVKKWREQGPKPLVPTQTRDIEFVRSEDNASSSEEYSSSGLWLFTDRKHATHHFEPNFLPPYTAEKRTFIMNILSKEWDEPTLTWKPAPPLPPPQLHPSPPPPPPLTRKEKAKIKRRQAKMNKNRQRRAPWFRFRRRNVGGPDSE